MVDGVVCIIVWLYGWTGARVRSVRIGARAVGGQVPNMQGVELRQALQGPPGARCAVLMIVEIVIVGM